MSSEYNKLPARYAQANGRTVKFLCSHPLNKGEEEKSIDGNSFVENGYKSNGRSRKTQVINSRTFQNTHSRHEHWPYILNNNL